MCSPSPRSEEERAALWDEVRRGMIDVVSSDHSGWRFDGTRGKRMNGENAIFRDIPNGVPGLAARLPVLFSEGVAKGRIDLNHLSDSPRRTRPSFSVWRAKAASPSGSDADLVLWDANEQVTITTA